MTVKSIAKAVTAAIGSFGVAFAAAADGGVTATEWVLIVCGALAAGVAVWAVPNKE